MNKLGEFNTTSSNSENAVIIITSVSRNFASIKKIKFCVCVRACVSACVRAVFKTETPVCK